MRSACRGTTSSAGRADVHVNAWAFPCVPMRRQAGVPGPDGRPATLLDLIEAGTGHFRARRADRLAGLVPYLEKTGKSVSSLEACPVGGAACPSRS